MLIIKKFYYLILCIRLHRIDIAANRTIPKNTDKIGKSLHLIYIYIVEDVYFRYKTSEIGKKLQNCIQLAMLFMFVEPRFRYPFLALLAHDNQTLESLFDSRVAGAHGGSTPQMNIMPVVPKKITP